MSDFTPNAIVLDRYVDWLEGHGQAYARAWGQRYRADREAAMCEATYWVALCECGATVHPNFDPTGAKQAPDYVCYAGGRKFYTEVTCIRIETATDYTKLSHLPAGAGFFSPLNDAIFSEVKAKTPQCANLDAPCVLAIGTFHFQASALCVSKTFLEWLLTGKTNISQQFDPERGELVGPVFQTTRFVSASFLRPSSLVGVEPARQPISALLVAGFGRKPAKILGVLHPNAVREFDPRLLGRIPFCQVRIDFVNATLSTEWSCDPDAPETA